jgi:hypothetical protein
VSSLDGRSESQPLFEMLAFSRSYKSTRLIACIPSRDVSVFLEDEARRGHLECHAWNGRSCIGDARATKKWPLRTNKYYQCPYHKFYHPDRKIKERSGILGAGGIEDRRQEELEEGGKCRIGSISRGEHLGAAQRA